MSVHSAYPSKLSEINQTIGIDVVWQPMSRQDHTNQLWMATVSGERVVLRLNASQNRAFGVSRAAEQRVLAAIAGFGWAPNILACDPQSGWCLMRFHGDSLEDKTISGLSYSDESQWLSAAIIQAIKELQSIKIGPKTIYSDLLKYYERHFANSKSGIEAQVWTAHLNELSSLLLPFTGQQQCMVHHDLHPGNFCIMKKQRKLVIIDWEYAGIGNPWLDCAQLLKSRLLTAEQLEQLPLWQSAQPETCRQYLHYALRFNELLDQLWSLARQTVV